MRPRDDIPVLTAVLFVVYWVFHPFVTLAVVTIVTRGAVLASMGFLVFVLGLLVLKGIPILLWGVDTPDDASFHTASITFAVTVLGMMDPRMVVYVAWTIPLVAFAVWWFRSHTPLAILVGFGIGVVGGVLT